MLITVVCVAGCGVVPEPAEPVAVEPPVFVDAEAAAAARPVDLVEPAVPEIVVPAAPEPSSGPLGRTVASLGNAAQPGLWLKTPLVSTERPGKVTSVQTGNTVDVTLFPIDGPPTAGSRISLSALQALDVPLTALSEVDVTAL